MPTPFATDTFSDTAGTNLSAHTPDTGGSWAYPSYETTPELVITAAGRLRNANSGQSTAIHSAVSSAAAVTVTWDLYAASLTGFIGVGVGAPSQATYGGYEARYDVSAGKWEILSFGSGSVLASVNYALTAGQTYHCQFEVPDGAVNPVKTLFVNGTSVLSTSDNAVTTTGRLYIDAYNTAAPTDSTGLQIDNVNIYNSAFAPASTNTLPPDSTGIVLSPGNQYIVPGTSLEWIHTATSAKFDFTGTSLAVNIDLSPLTGASISTSLYPYLDWSIDGGPWQRAQVAATVALATGIASGTHTCEVRYEPGDESDTWTPHSAIRITGWTLDTSATISAPTGNAAARPRKALLMGDSITRGYDAANIALTSYGPLLGHALNAEIGIVGYSGQGWGHAATNVAPAFSSTFDYYDSLHARVFPTLDYLIIAQGTNDGATTGLSSIIQAQLATMRAAVGARPLMVIILPPDGQQANTITTAVVTYIASSFDTRVMLVNLSAGDYGFQTGAGSATQFSVDGIHPTTEGHALIAADIAATIKAFESSIATSPHLMGSTNTVGGGCFAGL
jgi:lysophospholipase L1-like esterase